MIWENTAEQIIQEGGVILDCDECPCVGTGLPCSPLEIFNIRNNHKECTFTVPTYNADCSSGGDNTGDCLSGTGVWINDTPVSVGLGVGWYTLIRTVAPDTNLCDPKHVFASIQCNLSAWTLGVAVEFTVLGYSEAWHLWRLTVPTLQYGVDYELPYYETYDAGGTFGCRPTGTPGPASFRIS